jgi:hypothetical protein
MVKASKVKKIKIRATKFLYQIDLKIKPLFIFYQILPNPHTEPPELKLTNL